MRRHLLIPTCPPHGLSDSRLHAGTTGVTNQVHFYDSTDFSKGVVKKCVAKGMQYFKVSPGPGPCAIAAFIPGSKGGPAAVRLCKHRRPCSAYPHHLLLLASVLFDSIAVISTRPVLRHPSLVRGSRARSLTDASMWSPSFNVRCGSTAGQTGRQQELLQG